MTTIGALKAYDSRIGEYIFMFSDSQGTILDKNKKIISKDFETQKIFPNKYANFMIGISGDYIFDKNAPSDIINRSKGMTNKYQENQDNIIKTAKYFSKRGLHSNILIASDFEGLGIESIITDTKGGADMQGPYNIVAGGTGGRFLHDTFPRKNVNSKGVFEEPVSKLIQYAGICLHGASKIDPHTGGHLDVAVLMQDKIISMTGVTRLEDMRQGSGRVKVTKRYKPKFHSKYLTI